MRARWRWLLLVCLFMPPAFGAMPDQRLQEPLPVPVSTALTQEQVRQAVHAAADKLGWVISAESPGHSQATLILRGHMVRVDVAYETRLVTIQYVDSQNMNFLVEGNVAYIHRKYMQWTRNLAKEIGKHLDALLPKK